MLRGLDRAPRRTYLWRSDKTELDFAMGGTVEQVDFYGAIRPEDDFARLVSLDRFVPLPSDWVIGTADIVDSTGQITRGRYKTVNMIGAGVISAMVNAMQGQAFPFVFGGDGASFAVSPQNAGQARQALAAVRMWAASEFDIEMRAALVPVAEIRAAGHDVRVARFAASPGVDYAMFAGGGLAWAEARMKSGAFSVLPGPDTAPPDLTGLSCRWSNLRARNGSILSLVMEPAPGQPADGFAEIARRVVEIANQLSRGGHPVPPTGPGIAFPPPGLDLEARASRAGRSLLRRKLALLAENALAWLLFASGLKAGGFDPAQYRAEVGANADFRKFDDGLKMTLDCDAATRRRLETLLAEAAASGAIRYGLFEQDEALVTCFVPSVQRDDHMHFIDGAAGGYTRAAAQLKSA